MVIAPTAEPFQAEGEPDESGQRVGVLLVHGFTGSPYSLRPWAEALAAQGFAVRVPRLPGHGTDWRDLNKHRFEDWYAEAERGLEKLRADCDQVVVGGLSMGGALALRLAAERGRDVAGLVLVNPAVTIDRWDRHALPILKHLLPSVAGITDDIRKPGMTEHGYARSPLRAAGSMHHGFRRLALDLPRVTQPLLVLRSRVDHVVGPASVRIILSSVSSREVEEVVLEDSYHVATLDHDLPQIIEASAEFVRRVTGP